MRPRDLVLPRLMLVTNRAAMRPNFMEALAAALRATKHAETRVLIQLREPDATPQEWQKWLSRLSTLPHAARAHWLLNIGAFSRSEDWAKMAAHCDGLHFPERFLNAEYSGNIARNKLRGVSLHSPENAQRASTQGFDYAVFGSVFETTTHPNQRGAGIEKLRAVCAATTLPVFAIGGINAENAARVLAAGAYGIAVKDAAWNAISIESAVRKLHFAMAKTQ